MNPLTATENVNLRAILEYYLKKCECETSNVDRIKKLYNDSDSFNELMNKIIEKDYKKFQTLMTKNESPNSWRVFDTIMDIVQTEGNVIEPYDVITKSLPSKSLEYMGWTFSWVHGNNTLLSIYNRENELVYRF